MKYNPDEFKLLQDMHIMIILLGSTVHLKMTEIILVLTLIIDFFITSVEIH